MPVFAPIGSLNNMHAGSLQKAVHWITERRERRYGFQRSEQITELLTNRGVTLLTDAASDPKKLTFWEKARLGLELIHVHPLRFIGRGLIANPLNRIVHQTSTARKYDVQRLAAELREALGPESRTIIYTSYYYRRLFSNDMGGLPQRILGMLFRNIPDLVVNPDFSDLPTILTFAQARRLPVINVAAASRGFGETIPMSAGIMLDFSAKRKILEVDLKEGTMTVQPGVTFTDIFRQLGGTPWTLAAPSSIAGSIGGFITGMGLGPDAATLGSIHAAIQSLTVAQPYHSELRTIGRDDKVVLSTEGKVVRHRELDFICGKEGLSGSITEIKLNLTRTEQATPTRSPSRHYAVSFTTETEAIAFLKEVGNDKKLKVQCRLLDADYMKYLEWTHQHKMIRRRRRTLKDRPPEEEKPSFTGLAEAISQKRDYAEELRRFGYLPLIEGQEFRQVVVIKCDTEDQTAVEEIIAQKGGRRENERLTSYLKHEEYRTMEVKRVVKGMGVTEVIVPLDRVEAYLVRCRRLASNYKTALTTELHVVDHPDRKEGAPPKKAALLLIRTINSLPLCAVLTREAVRRFKGQVYSRGAWNAAQLRTPQERSALEDFMAYKAKVDPENIINPGKLRYIETRSGMAASLLLNERVFNLGIALFTRAILYLPRISGKFFAPKDAYNIFDPELNDLQAAFEHCARCRYCTVKCHAALIDRDARERPYAKLEIASSVLERRTHLLTDMDLLRTFRCLRCGECQRTCPVGTANVGVWDSVEEIVWAELVRRDPKDLNHTLTRIHEMKITLGDDVAAHTDAIVRISRQLPTRGGLS